MTVMSNQSRNFFLPFSSIHYSSLITRPSVRSFVGANLINRFTFVGGNGSGGGGGHDDSLNTFDNRAAAAASFSNNSNSIQEPKSDLDSILK